MSKFFLHLPQDFDDHGWEIESKGWYQGAQLIDGKKKYRLTFYAPFRLNQDIEHDIESHRVFFEKNLLIVSVVNRGNMEAAVRFLAETKQVDMLIPEMED